MGLKLQKSTAKKIYPDAPDWFKEVLEENFGKECFIKRDWRDIDSYEDAVEMRPVDEDDIIYPTDRPHIVALKKLCHITKVVNGNWEADFNDSKQPKWEQVFLSSGSGFDFSYSFTLYGLRGSIVGSRLCCASKEQSDFIGQKFTTLFKVLITNKN
jgi:hypothetical protein